MDGAGGFLSGFGGGDRLEEVQFYRALRLGNNGADGLPQADVAVVGGMGVRAAAVGVGIAAEDGQQGDACFVGRLKKAGFKGEDAAAFGAGAFRKEGYGVAVLQGFGNAADFFAVAFGAFVAGDVNGLRLCGEVADNRPFGHVVFGDEATGEGGVYGHDVQP